MKVKQLKEILSTVADDAEVVIGVWLEQCRDTPALTGVDYIDHRRQVEGELTGAEVITIVTTEK